MLEKLRRERDCINRMKTQKVEAERQLVFEDKYEQGTRRQSMVGQVVEDVGVAFHGIWKWVPLILIGLFIILSIFVWIGTALND